MSSFFIHLMRHGEPETTGLMLGRTDIPSTPAGIAACAEQTRDLPFCAIITSDLMRAAQAAQAIGKQHALTPIPDPDWREIDFGEWDGLAPAMINNDAIGAFWRDPNANPPPGGERWSQFERRVTRALAAIPDRDTLIITHGGAIRAALASLFGFNQRQLWAFDLPYSSVLSLRVWPGNPRNAQIAGLWA